MTPDQNIQDYQIMATIAKLYNFDSFWPVIVQLIFLNNINLP